MKRYGSFFKNIAALIMLLALLALLLPMCKITTQEKTSTVSGIQGITIGAKLGQEYYKNGTIKNSHVVVDTVTWGDLKGGVSEGVQHKEFKKTLAVGIIVILPVFFCFLAMLFTFMAGGKIAMVLPTILIGLASLETMIGVGAFSKIQELLVKNAETSVSLSVGVYAFMLLCILAFGILLALWVTGGFNRPTRRERRYYDSDDEYDDDDDKERRTRRKKDGPSRREKRRKKRRRKDKKKDRKRRKSDRKSSKNNNTKEQQPEIKEAPKNQSQKDNVVNVQPPVGRLSGLTGLYQGANIDLSGNQMGSYTIGTTKEAMDALINNSFADIDKLQGNTCDILYSTETKQYTITSHSIKDIILQNGSAAQQQIRLGNGQSVIVDPDTLLYIGDFNNIIKLD